MRYDRFIGEAVFGCMMILATPASADPSDNDETGTIVITGQKLETVASAGTKTSAPLIETPQSISVIGAGEISGLGLQNLNQALRFVAGITP